MPTSALNRTITQLNADLLKLDTVEQNAASDQSKADIDALGIDAATVNSLTVETSVPSGAVFTDTVYDDTSLVAAVASKENAFTKNAAFNKDFGSAAGTVCEGDDARLSDARTPLAHAHVKADITDFSDADYATAAQGALADSALQAETVTDISFNSTTKILSYTDENGTPTNIDLSAAFVDTDTIYDDSDVLKDADTASPVTAVNKLMTQDDVAGLGGGDMLKSTYDTNNNGKVDSAENADTVNSLTVETAVPVGAVFTDTTYSALSEFTNDTGYITDYTVTEADVTTHQAALSLTESQISDLGSYEPADATILKDADIGSTVQGYDANTVIDASYVHTDNNYTTVEKTKLANVADNANNYSLPNATSTVVGGVKMRYDSGTDTLYLTNDGTDA
jgi:hypothetical protein